MKRFADLVVSEREELSCLTLDAEDFKNSGSYRRFYNIPQDETLLIYVNSNRCYNELSGYGTLITDEAIYVHPVNGGPKNSGRIPLSDICSFIVYVSPESDVKLFGENKEYKIFSATGKPARTTSGQLAKLLSGLQNSLMSDPDNKKEYERTLKRVYTILKKELSYSGFLREEYLSIVQVMGSFQCFQREALLLLLENSYRSCNKAGYQALLEEFAPSLEPATLKVLENPGDVFYQNFISDLSNNNSCKDLKFIIDSYLNLKAEPRLSIREATILMYLCIRMDDQEYFNSLLRETGDDLEQEDLWTLMAFYARNRNHRVHKIQSRLAGCERVSDQDLLSTNDIGLCSLHYVLMLGNTELIQKTLPLCDWTKIKSPFPKERMVSAMYDPMFLASITYKNDSLLKHIFIHTSPMATALNKSIKGLDSMIDINQSLKKKYPELKADYAAKIDEFRALRRDMKSELEKLAKEEVRRQRKLAEMIRAANHPFCDYLFHLFSGEKALITWLSSTTNRFRLSKYKTLFFVTAPEEDLSLSWYEWNEEEIVGKNVLNKDTGYLGNNRKDGLWENRSTPIYENPTFREAMEKERKAREEKERRRQEFKERVENPAPFAGSWFSEDARKDIRSLKEEYRVLVKKYHPDASGDHRTAKVLMRIMAERAEILEAMGRAFA